MPLKSQYPSIDLPQANIFTWLFGDGPISNEPVLLDSKLPQERNLSPLQILQWSKRLAFGLEQLGLKKGDVVMICTPNHIFIPVAYLGTVGAGIIFSGANPMYTVRELANQMIDTSAKAALVHPQALTNCLEAAAEAGLPKSHIFQFSDEPIATQNDVLDWRDMIGTPSQGEAWQSPRLSPEEADQTIASLNYTSGTTGNPKGVCMSHNNIIACVEIIKVHNYATNSSDAHQGRSKRTLTFLPLYHAYGQVMVLISLKLNSPLYIMSAFNFEDFLRAVQTSRITDMPVAPPILAMLAKRPETSRYDISSLRTVLSSAASLSGKLQNECQDRFGFRISQAYGMTEVCGAISMPTGFCEDTGSIGKLVPNLEAKLVDDDGNEVATGEQGELHMRGPTVCMGYWKNEAATKETIDEDRWLKTGDVARCNDEGLFWIVDRKKEMINVNLTVTCLMIAPAELESLLLENEHVADAGVVGVTIKSNEWPRAYIALQPTSVGKVTAEDIQSWVETRIVKYKHLVGGVAFVDQVPRLPSGKLHRKIIREWAERDAPTLVRGP